MPSSHYVLASRSTNSLIKSKSIRCINNIRFSTDTNSSSRNTDDDATTEQETPAPPTASVVTSSLRRMIKPFLLKCHPDIQQQRSSKEEDDDDNEDTSRSISQEDTSWAKAINLRAIQNLNSYLDSIQTLLQESSSSIRRGTRNPKNNDASSSLVEIDFVIAVQSSSSSTWKSAGGKRRHQSSRNRGIEWHQSRRKVQLVLPQQKQQHDKNNVASMSFLERHFHSELVRLLRVAGLEVPSYSFHLHHSDDGIDGYAQDREGGVGQAPKGPFWHDGAPSHFHFANGVGKRGPRVATTSASSSIFSRYKANREHFVREAAELGYDHRLFQHALAESLIEDETAGLIANNAERRQDLIARILAKVQIQKEQQEQQVDDPTAPSSSSNFKNDDIVAAAPAASNSVGVGVVVDDAGLEQLLAMRRLSLVLDDNFQVLQLEELGRLWENLTLVLLPPTPWDDDDNDNDDTVPEGNNKTTRRRVRRSKRRRRQQQQQQQQKAGTNAITMDNDNLHAEQWMDYAWTLHPDWSVTMYIPMDFDPDELVQEIERNVQDFNRLLEEQTYPHYFGGGGGGGFYNHDTTSSSASAAL
jgi:hypothetical protein